LFLVVKTLESMISRPLVEKSRELNMPSWLLLPTVGCFGFGFLYAFSPTSVLNTQSTALSELSWIAPLFIVTSGMFLLLALLAWFLRSYPILSTRRKQHKSIVTIAFILVSLFVGAALTTVFFSSIYFNVSLVHDPISEATRGQLACFIDRSGSCTLCDTQPTDAQCPEWSRLDVTRILQSQSKAGASLAAICFLYAVGALRYGFTMRKHIRSYQIEYV
jgi:multisubunit Na+/H+ antiporter MnhC subunit